MIGPDNKTPITPIVGCYLKALRLGAADSNICTGRALLMSLKQVR
jgi:hypothetical protein